MEILIKLGITGKMISPRTTKNQNMWMCDPENIQWGQKRQKGPLQLASVQKNKNKNISPPFLSTSFTWITRQTSYTWKKQRGVIMKEKKRCERQKKETNASWLLDSTKQHQRSKSDEGQKWKPRRGHRRGRKPWRRRRGVGLVELQGVDGEGHVLLVGAAGGLVGVRAVHDGAEDGGDGGYVRRLVAGEEPGQRHQLAVPAEYLACPAVVARSFASVFAVALQL